MNIKYLMLLTAFCSIGLSGCNKDEEGSLTVVFQSTFDGQPLVASDIYDYGFGQRIQFTRSEFYISNLRILDGDNNAVELTDIELIDMTANDAASAENGVRLTFGDIPAKTYSKIQFGIGVDSDLNQTVPADYPSSHPLSDPGSYWIAWSSYIFGKTEGNLDTLADGTDDLDIGWLFHTGTDAYYISLEATENIAVTDDGNTTLTIRLDHRVLMGLPDDPVDIKKKPVNHNPTGNETEYNKLFGNYTDALTLSIQ